MRRVIYITGTRADFGLMESTLRGIADHPDLELGIFVTGAHLDREFGHTVDEVRASGLPVLAEIAAETEPRTGLTMAKAAGTQLSGIAESIADADPDIVLLLGDRPEMLAGAFAAVLQSRIVAHVHGGERSGSIDESIRHAVSKFAHYHFVATQHSAERLEKLGEKPENIFRVGAPGLDNIGEDARHSKEEICEKLSIEESRKLGVAVYHPVTHEVGSLGGQVETVIKAMLDADLDVVFFRPNSDAGGDEIDEVLHTYDDRDALHIVTHLDRGWYLSLLRNADIMVGNSSSGIIEAASFALPVVDVGSRQNYRERGDNVRQAAADYDAIGTAIRELMNSPRDFSENIYGDGRASGRIVGHLAEISLDASVKAKVNAY